MNQPSAPTSPRPATPDEQSLSSRERSERNKRTLARLALAAALVLTGCGPYGVARYRAPFASVRDVETLDLPADSGGAATQATTRVVPTTLPVPEPPQERNLTLGDVRALALQNNLDLKVSRFDPIVANENLNAEEAAFEALFVAQANYTNTDQPTASQLTGSSVEDIALTPGISQPLRTGGVLTVDVPLDRFKTSNQFSTLNPAYSSDVRVALTQPLLRGFGPDATEYGIRVATAQLGQAQAQQKLQVINVLSGADRTYWVLYATARATAVRRQQYELAVQQLERAQRLLRAGEQPEVEVIRAASDVADATETVIQAEEDERIRQRELKRFVNSPDLPIGGPTRLLPQTLPSATYYETDTQALIRAALTRRMELLDAELRVAIEVAGVLLARNQGLPRLDLTYQYTINGLGSNFDDSFRQVGDYDYKGHTAGLSLEIPLGNRQRRAQLRAALLRRMQQLASKEALILQVRQEVLDAADRLQTAWQRILAAQRRVALAQRLFDAETRQFELGLNTGLEVTQARANLADAQLSEITATTDYEVARIDLAVATGTVIGKDRVVLDVANDAPGRY